MAAGYLTSSHAIPGGEVAASCHMVTNGDRIVFMKVMTARVVGGKIDVGDAELQEGAAVAVLVSEGSDFHLSQAEEEELELALGEIRGGNFRDGHDLLQDLKGLTNR